MREAKTKYLTLAGIIASIYAVLCIVLGNLSYLGIQIRLATFLEPIPFYFVSNNKIKNAGKIGVILGCVIANMASPLGLIDVAFGIVEEILLLYVLYGKVKNNRILQTIAYTVINSVLVALELYLIYNVPYVYSLLTVGIPAFILFYVGTFMMEKVESVLSKNNLI